MHSGTKVTKIRSSMIFRNTPVNLSTWITQLEVIISHCSRLKAGFFASTWCPQSSLPPDLIANLVQQTRQDAQKSPFLKVMIKLRKAMSWHILSCTSENASYLPEVLQMLSTASAITPSSPNCLLLQEALEKPMFSLCVFPVCTEHFQDHKST